MFSGRLYKTIGIVAIMLFVSVGTFGGFYTTMSMQDGEHSSCPFMGTPVFCAMTPLQHLSEWQSQFMGVVGQQVLGMLMLMGMTVLFVILSRPKEPPESIGTRLSLHAAPLLDHLRLAFAKGILNPKVF